MTGFWICLWVATYWVLPHQFFLFSGFSIFRRYLYIYQKPEMEFTDFRTVQKIKFSIKDFFSKWDQMNASFSENVVNILTEWSTSAAGFWKTLKLMGTFRSSHRKYSIKRLFLKISQYLQEKTCVGVSFQ